MMQLSFLQIFLSYTYTAKSIYFIPKNVSLKYIDSLLLTVKYDMEDIYFLLLFHILSCNFIPYYANFTPTHNTIHL